MICTRCGNGEASEGQSWCLDCLMGTDTTRAVYLIGSPGVGKSTFMSEILDVRKQVVYDPLREYAQARNSKGARTTLRGHPLRDPEGPWGVYLGVMRDHHPGADGLDRVSYLAGSVWAREGQMGPRVVGEGLSLAVRPFLTALDEASELMVVHLVASEETVLRRIGVRGTTQSPKFVAGTATRMANLALWATQELRGTVLTVDTDKAADWDLSADLVLAHLK